MALSQRILLIDTEEIIPGVTKLNLRGRLDAPGAQIIDNAFARMAGAQERLIVDLVPREFHRLRRIAHPDRRRQKPARAAGQDGVSRPRSARRAGAGPQRRRSADPGLPGNFAKRFVWSVSAAAPAAATPRMSRCHSTWKWIAPWPAIRRVGAWVDELAILLNLSGETEYALRLCLEEAVTNIVNHATPEPGVEKDSVALHLLGQCQHVAPDDRGSLRRIQPARHAVTRSGHSRPRRRGRTGHYPVAASRRSGVVGTGRARPTGCRSRCRDRLLHPADRLRGFGARPCNGRQTQPHGRPLARPIADHQPRIHRPREALTKRQSHDRRR